MYTWLIGVWKQITDECPNCGTNHLDLYSDAFAKLADPSKGIISVSYDFITCPITSPIILHNKGTFFPFPFSLFPLHPPYLPFSSPITHPLLLLPNPNQTNRRHKPLLLQHANRQLKSTHKIIRSKY